MAKIVASTYADALFDLAIEKNMTEQWQTEIETISGILAENPDFNKLMEHPQITKEEKLKLAAEAFDGKADPEIVGFIRIIIEKDRYSDVDAIFEEFISRVKTYNGIGKAYVRTAIELTDKQKDAVVAKLLETTDFKSIEVDYTVDESLIAGMVIRIGDRVVDSSVRTRLDGLRSQLLQAQV